MKSLFVHHYQKILLFLILILAAFFRLYNINWDQGFHLHPDERAIVMATTPLHLPNTMVEFFSPQSPLNSHFFAYGNFPIYLLKILGQVAGFFDPLFSAYDKINLLGRIISACADIATVFLIFKIARKIFTETIGVLASFFYAVSVLPIQLSHFYAVDTLLTFFMLRTVYQLLLYYQQPSIKNVLLIGVFFGLSLATKISASVIVVSLLLTLTLDFLFIFLKKPHQPKHYLPHVPHLFKKLFSHGLLIMLISLFIFIVFNPYTVIASQEFITQTLQQYQMTHDAFTFPYTLQYVGKIPYLYEMKNIFLFGMGPFVGIFAFLGTFFFFFSLIKNTIKHNKESYVLSSFFLMYFLTVGNFAIGFMRYMLPLYPLLALFAAILIDKIMTRIPKQFHMGFYTCVIFFSLLWPIAFLHIYTQPPTRVTASQWIYKNIPQNKTIAIEHWDDQLPMGGATQYTTVTLPLYDYDNAEKWGKINSDLLHTDYIIIASNRLYIPLQKLKNCTKLFPHPCYQLTAVYYENLFSGTLGFTKVAEFEVNPTLPLFNMKINDQSADESFTVYDHPKIMIFKKI